MKVCQIPSLYCTHEECTCCQYVIRLSTHGQKNYFSYFSTPEKNIVLITIYLMTVTLEEKVSNLVSSRKQHCRHIFKIRDGTTAKHLSKSLLYGQSRNYSQNTVVTVVVHIITKPKFLRNVLHCTLLL